MSKTTKKRSGIIFLVTLIALLVGIILTGKGAGEESIKVIMKDAVLHDNSRISLFGIAKVNPGLISAYIVTAVIILFALIVRIFVIPKFTTIPGKFQLLLEEGVKLFDGLAKSNSPHRNGFLGAYIFAAGAYIFIGTLFELFGFQVMTTNGGHVVLPAPLADINAAIALGVMSYGVIMSGGIATNGIKGALKTLKDFSLPISMSFRMFGALLSGALVSELVYYYAATRYVIPVLVGVLFTLLHALIQAYVLTMLTSMFYGEVSEKTHKENKSEEKQHEQN